MRPVPCAPADAPTPPFRYARISSTPDAGAALDRQLEAARKCAAEHDLIFVAETRAADRHSDPQ
jgi:hypothetical protein